ncbi:glycosyl transferase, partial [Streptococcus ruminantium]|nr:glycosyl transferase [Streptococcus ruminantium]
IIDWFQANNIKENGYYLVVGRFVPENNYETMIREFMKSNSKKDFVLITNVEQNAFYNKLRKETGFDQDPRIKFVGTVYNQEL